MIVSEFSWIFISFVLQNGPENTTWKSLSTRQFDVQFQGHMKTQLIHPVDLVSTFVFLHALNNVGDEVKFTK